MVSRCPVPTRAPRITRLPRAASLGVAAAAMAAPLGVVLPAAATPAGGALPTTPLLPHTPMPTTPLPTTPVGTTPLPATPQPATPLPATPQPDTVVTRTVLTPANVRSGPGTNHGVVGGLAQGAEVTGRYTSNGWFDMGNGRFVFGELLSGSTPNPTPPAPTPPGGDTVTRVVTVGSNVRSGPGTNYSVVGGLTQGTQVTGRYTNNNWFDMGNGRFVFGELLDAPSQPAPPAPTPPSPPSPPPSDTVTRVVTTGANVRSGPGTNYSIVGGLAQGTQVTGRYTNNNWFDMGNSRFVSGGLLADPSQPAPPTPPAPPAPQPPPPGAVTGAAVLAEAAKYEGVMYLWGGSTPAGFDCSGYTSYVFGQLGISLPRTAAQQQAWAASTTAPRPGDLVFFGYPAYHVGIYAGNNMMWDAPRPGLTVGLRQIWDSGDISYGKVPGVVN